MLLQAQDVVLYLAQCFGVVGLLGQQFVEPLLVGLVAGEAAQEVCTRHARITYAQLHDGALLRADLILHATHAGDQCVVLLGHQLDRHEQGSQGFQFGDGLRAAAFVLLQRLANLFQLLLNGTEALTSYFRVGTAVTFALFLFAVVLFFLVLIIGDFLVVLGLGCRSRRSSVIGTGHAVVIRIDIAVEDIGQASAFFGDTLVFGEDAVDGAGEHGDGSHDLADAFLDAFGDFDLAFAGQQFDGTHFTHVHAHRVSGAANVAFHSGQSGGGFFRGGFVGVTVGQQQSIGIGCSLEDRDPHVVDHANDVFNLFRI